MQTLIIRIEDPSPDRPFLTICGLSVSADGSEAGEADGRLPWPLPPFPGQEGEDPLALMRETMLTELDPRVSAAEVGRYLWHLIGRTPVGGWWERQAATGGVRTLLDVGPVLRRLPWELLAPEPEGVLLFQDEDKPWARGSGAGLDSGDLLVPVRLLVIIGQVADQALQADQEIDGIVGALRDVPAHWHVDVLCQPRPDRLRAVLEELRPHVLHLIAHGRIDPGTNAPVLDMAIEAGRTWELTTTYVAQLPRPAPRLVVLNACRTGASGAGTGAGPDAGWSFADAFARLGSGAVVTMQGDIPSVAAVPFAERFYAKVAQRLGVDVAAASGRLGAYDAGLREQDRRGWAMPSLYLRARPDRVLPVRLGVPHDPVTTWPYSEAYRDVRVYVDRTAKIRHLVRAFDPENGVAAPLLAVTGRPNIGKSAVLRSALLTCQLRGRNVVYVDFTKMRDPEWLTALRYVRDQVQAWLQEPAADPVGRFNHELGFYLAGEIPAAYVPGTDPGDDLQAFNYTLPDYRGSIRHIFASFVTMLRSAAASAPFLLGLDNTQAIDPADLAGFVVPDLLTPLSLGTAPNLHVVIACTPDWFEQLRINHPRLRILEPSEIESFEWEQIGRLGRDFWARQHPLPVSPAALDILRTFEAQRLEGTGENLKIVLKAVELMAGSR